MSIKAKIAAELAERVKGGDGLAMDFASRMQRAKEQGFDTDTTYYHGTNADIKSFDPKKFGSATESKSATQGVWLSDSPDTARSYADYAAKDLQVKRQLEKADIAEAKGDWDAYDDAIIKAEELEADIYDQPNRGQTIMPLSARGKMLEFDAEGSDFMDIQEDIDRVIKSAKSQGYSGVDFKNLSDDVGFSGRSSNHRVVFDPKNIRSVNAAFDPAKKDSSNLLADMGAGLAATGGLSSLLAQGGEPLTGVAYAPKSETLGKLSNLLQRVETPIGYPFGGLADYINKFNYGDDIGYLDRLATIPDPTEFSKLFE